MLLSLCLRLLLVLVVVIGGGVSPLSPLVFEPLLHTLLLSVAK